MNEQQSALAYGRAYELFSQIYRHGLDDDSAALLNIEKSDVSTNYKAEHYQLFIHNVYPYETIFLGEECLLGGTITEHVAAFYQRIGFQPDTDESADHISSELDAMAHLCFAEYDAAVDEVPHHVQRVRQLQRRLLDEHLLRWLPAFVMAIEQQNTSVYTAIVSQTFDLVCTHRAQLGEDLMASDNQFVLATPPDLLTDEKTSLRDIAHYLLTPAYTGFYVSSSDIKRMGSRFRIPHGFGKRQQILTNLLRTASDYDVFPNMMLAFKAIATKWHDELTAMTGLPTAIRDVWMEQLQSTVTLLSKIEDLARNQNIIMDDEVTDLAVANGQARAGCAIEKDTIDSDKASC